ncbi:MAG: DUF808 domain-containing protein [Paracoccaceae bacterium]
MSGLLALLDDVAGIAKLAAASVDDVIGQAAKAGSKAAGAVIDDAAVTPKYVQGFSADRELPIIWRIAKGSFFNKLVILLPIALLLNSFAPWLIPPLLMLGGAYLCFEGAEKVAHAMGFGGHGHDDYPGKADTVEDPAHLEEQKAKGAIKTDFILSAEIMTISLAAIPASNFWMESATLATVAVLITVAVYGAVAIIVKMDDLGLAMARTGSALMRALGRGIVAFMPYFMKALLIIGTAAMLWVGGEIIVHGAAQMGFSAPEHAIYAVAKFVAGASDGAAGFIKWLTKAGLNGILGLGIGLALIPVGEKLITPIWRSVFARGQ